MRFRRRLLLLYVVFCLGLGLVWLRAGQLQIVDGDEWEEAARRQRHQPLRLEALRGAIISGDGVVLAEDSPVFQLAVHPLQWKYRERARCTGCGAIYFFKKEGRPPKRCACRRSLERGGTGSGSSQDAYPRGEALVEGHLEHLPPSDLAPLEEALRLEPGALELAADARLAEIERLVESKRAALIGDGREPPFLKERLRMRRLDLLKRPYVIAADIPEDAVRLVQTNEMGRYRGFGIEVALRRRYPLGDLAPQLIGYTTQIASRKEYLALRDRHGRRRITHSTRLGRCGLERAYNWRLHGDPGLRVRELDSEGSFTKIVSDEPPQQGRALRLSLDAQVTHDAERILDQLATAEGYLPKGRPSGAFVMLDAHTGEILVWGEAPRYNLNVDLGRLYDPKRTSARANDETGVWDPPPGVTLDQDLETWRLELVRPVGETMSRVSQIAVEAGSTFKPLIGLSMLSSGLPLPHASFFCGDSNVSPGCHRCGYVDLELALTRSCNRYFAFSLRDSKHWPRYRSFVAGFVREFGIGQVPGSEIAEWSRGMWLRRDGYDFPLETAVAVARERMEKRAAQQRAASDAQGPVVPELKLVRSPRAPATVGGDPKQLGRTLADIAQWVSRHSGARQVLVHVSQERVEGSKVVLKFGLRAAGRPAWFSLLGAHTGQARLPEALRRRKAEAVGIAGRVERGGTVWFTETFDRRMGRTGPDAPPVIRPDDGRNVAIGQGPVLVTPLQMARAMAVIANGGTLVEPHVVPDLGAGRRLTERKRLPIDARHLQRVRNGMYGVANTPEGTATNSRCNWHRVPAEVYGKTGTAQVGGTWKPFTPVDPEGPWHHWFVGFAEAPGKRTVAFACLLHARLEAGGGLTAAPATQEILEHWFNSPLSDRREP